MTDRTRNRTWKGRRPPGFGRLRERVDLRGGEGGGADAGMATSEYAMGTIAACAFAAVLYKVITGSAVAGALESLIGKALDAQF
ncbi:DUF4244 domain-containing protein [Streptomyces sp. CAU 1734]|uniref:DUF4244 domain-containing protein n=1 Tax=Streptomyces sp. CAU 1734 TaxID=3140360 RepID=UPI00325FEC9E